MTTKVMNFKETVTAGNAGIYSDNSPLYGKIDNVMMHFPPGANALVDVAVYAGGLQIIPKEGYIALDDVTAQFPVEAPINLGEEVRVKIQNRDAVFSHTISITLIITGEITEGE